MFKVGGKDYWTRLLEFADLFEKFYPIGDIIAGCHRKLAFKILNIWQLL